MGFVVLAPIFSACPGIDESAPPPREHGVAQDWTAIRETFDRYKDALREQDGHLAADLISRQTLGYYEEMRTLAATAGPGEIRKQSFMNRLLITRIRIGVPLLALRKMTGREVFALGVEEGWTDAGTTSRQELGGSMLRAILRTQLKRTGSRPPMTSIGSKGSGS